MKRDNFFKEILKMILKLIYPPIIETKNTAGPITFKTLFFQKILRFNSNAYWPVHFSSVVNNPKNILIGVGTAPGLSPGCYIQGTGKIYIGDYTIIAPNVGIISANHNVYDYRLHHKGFVKIGKYCWLGMNSVVLPNVTIGDHTIVAANSVVKDSFPEGFQILAGNPAKVVKKLDIDLCKKNEFKNKYEYYGYIRKKDFKYFALKNLNFLEDEINKWLMQ